VVPQHEKYPWSQNRTNDYRLSPAKSSVINSHVMSLSSRPGVTTVPLHSISKFDICIGWGRQPMSVTYVPLFYTVSVCHLAVLDLPSPSKLHHAVPGMGHLITDR
jgi:hypothetical protein